MPKYQALRRTAEILINDYEEKIAFFQQRIDNLLKFMELTETETYTNKRCLNCKGKPHVGDAFCSSRCRDQYTEKCFSCELKRS